MKTAVTGEPASLLARLPAIRRARGWRLYAENGRRFLDLWSDGGRSAAGRRTGNQGRLAKELLDRGLVSGLPSFWEDRLRKELASWMPAYSRFLFFSTEFEVLSLLEDFGLSAGRARPFGSWLGDDAGAGADLVLVTLPLAPAWSFAVLALKEGRMAGELPDPQPLATIKLALGARALSEFRRFEREIGEPHWARMDRYISGLFERKGPWLIPRYAADAHAQFFDACLASGILISPCYGEPSIIPGEFEDGEVAALGKLPRP
jgi:hypothetical protein